jgi:hypothetical protein
MKSTPRSIRDSPPLPRTQDAAGSGVCGAAAVVEASLAAAPSMRAAAVPVCPATNQTRYAHDLRFLRCSLPPPPHAHQHGCIHVCMYGLSIVAAAVCVSCPQAALVRALCGLLAAARSPGVVPRPEDFRLAASAARHSQHHLSSNVCCMPTAARLSCYSAAGAAAANNSSSAMVASHRLSNQLSIHWPWCHT